MTADPGPTDLVDLLQADHRRIEDLIAAGGASHELVHELAVHLVAEAHVLYPEARDTAADVDQLVDGALEFDHGLEEALSDLDRDDTPEHREAVVRRFQGHVQLHEERILPQVRAAVAEDRRVVLADALLAAVRQAPRHPHPRLPDEGPLAVIADSLAARVDELRDAYRAGREGRDDGE